MKNVRQSSISQAELDIVEPRLAELLVAATVRREFPRVLLGFTTDRGDLDVRRSLQTQDTWRIVYAKQTDGLIGLTLTSGEMQHWERGSDKPFTRGDARTVEEYCYPVRVGDEVVAVLLFDFFEGETSFDTAAFSACANKLLHNCEEVLGDSDKEKASMHRMLRSLTDDIRRSTKSVRGYTAIRNWDGSIEYFAVGENTELFRQLNFEEGLSGHAFKSQEIINLGDVWRHPLYISSDQRVTSEIVVPLVIGGRCLGVLNLESYSENAYTDANIENEVTSFADQVSTVCAQLIERNNRGTPSYILASAYLNSHFGENKGIFESDGASRTLLENSIAHLEKAIGFIFSDAMSIDAVSDVDLVGKRSSSASHFEPTVRPRPHGVDVTFFVILRGRAVALLDVALGSHPSRVDIDSAQTLCRMASVELARSYREIRQASLYRLVDRCNSSVPGSSTWMTQAHEIAFLLDADDVCCFELIGLSDGTSALLPVTTNGAPLVGRPGNPGYYCVESGSSLTAQAVRRTQISVFDQFSKLPTGANAVLLSDRPTNYLIEDRDSEIRAAIYIPIFESSICKGLVRARRRRHGVNRPFLRSEIAMAAFIQGFFSHSL